MAVFLWIGVVSSSLLFLVVKDWSYVWFHFHGARGTSLLCTLGRRQWGRGAGYRGRLTPEGRSTLAPNEGSRAPHGSPDSTSQNATSRALHNRPWCSTSSAQSLGLCLSVWPIVHAAELATRVRAAKSSLCRALWWRSARNPHCCQGHARRRTHAHRRPSACVVPSAPHRARHGRTARTRGDRRKRGHPRRDGLWRRTPTRPMTPSAAGASGTIVRGRCRPQAGCTPCGRVVDTSPARGLGFTL